MESRTTRIAPRLNRRTARDVTPARRGRLLTPAVLEPGVLKSGLLDPRAPIEQ
ncbi:MAG: hypothetical protein HKN44_01265 [Ilumatobacter sp.]|nr:hypothetical protein [Ilumatobacter sp.]